MREIEGENKKPEKGLERVMREKGKKIEIREKANLMINFDTFKHCLILYL